MQLKVQRSQRANVMGKILFCLDVRADYAPEEKHNIQRYKIGREILYSSQAARKHADRAIAQLDRAQSGTTGESAAGLARGVFSLALANLSLSISIDSLGKGHHIECKDLEELLDAEETVRAAAKNLTRYLQIASTFDGRELVIEYENGEEKIHAPSPAAIPRAPSSLPAVPSAPVAELPKRVEAPDAEFEDVEPALYRGPEPDPAYEAVMPSSQFTGADPFAEIGKAMGLVVAVAKEKWLEIERNIVGTAHEMGLPFAPWAARGTAVAFTAFILYAFYEIL